MIGLFPFYLFHQIFKGTQILQHVSVNRVHERPHSGRLLYERRSDISFYEFNKKVKPFIKYNIVNLGWSRNLALYARQVIFITIWCPYWNVYNGVAAWHVTWFWIASYVTYDDYLMYRSHVVSRRKLLLLLLLTIPYSLKLNQWSYG